MWQGPHHEAQKSISTGTDAVEIAASNAAAFGTSIGWAGLANAALHLPHCVARSSAAYFSRFVVPHALHATNTPLSSSVIVKPPSGAHTPSVSVATQMPVP